MRLCLFPSEEKVATEKSVYLGLGTLLCAYEHDRNDRAKRKEMRLVCSAVMPRGKTAHATRECEVGELGVDARLSASWGAPQHVSQGPVDSIDFPNLADDSSARLMNST